MTRDKVIKLVAAMLSTDPDTRATVSHASIALAYNGGGKRGWRDAGGVRVLDSGEVEFTDIKTTQFMFKCCYKSELYEQISHLRAEPVAPVAAPVGPDLAAAARLFRAGKAVAEDLVVACVAGGHLATGEAMNRDW